MNNCKMIHETVLRDIVDIINNVKDYDEVKWIQSKNDVGSIAKRASNLVLVFPVLVSNSLNINTASIISKAIERKCVALLQILFASVNLTDAENLREYLSQFHTNLNNQLTLDNFMDALDRLDESGEIEITDRDAYEAVREDMRNINYYLSTNFNPSSINSFTSKTDLYGNTNIIKEDSCIFNEANGGNNNISDDDILSINVRDYKKIARDMNKQAWDNANKMAKQVATNIANQRIGNSVNTNKINEPSLKDKVSYFRYQLLPQDVVKANELMPTLLTVNFGIVDKDTKIVHYQTGIIGVKAKLYPIDSMDIVTRLSSKYNDNNTLFKFIKASTREISFFRDFAFAIDKAKFDAINVARESNNAKIFKLLERRAAKNKFSSMIKKNDASAITTLVISQDEVEYLKKYHNIDMQKTYVARPIMEAYNLMGFVTADESMEIARFLYDDGDSNYEAITFDGLQKEAKDSSYKKIINLMSKISR